MTEMSDGKKKLTNADADGEMVGAAPVVEEETRCGVLWWRPACLQSCANIRAFTAVMGFITVFANVNLAYYTAVITQIEKQFGLSSSMTGFIKNVDNIGFLSTVLFIGHFCRYANKPRLFSAATLIVSGAVALFALPHFLYFPKTPDIRVEVNNGTGNTSYTVTNSSGSVAEDHLCTLSPVGESEENRCKSRTLLTPFNAGAFAIFIVSELIQGAATAPKAALSMTYMDDNAGKESPKYLGFMFAARAISPILGFLLGAWAISKYVDLSETTLTPRDPRWVGAWWLGFLICAVITVVWAVPMACFPPVLKEELQRRQAEEGHYKPPPSMLDKMKDLPKALCRLLTNRIYTVIIIAAAFEVNMMGFQTFLPKYIENHFRQTPGMASIIAGTPMALAFGVGPVISGVITSRLTPHPFSIIKLATGISVLCIALYVVLMLLGCDHSDMVADLSTGSLNVTSECNAGCSCDDLDYRPVCGDGRTYFSPCHAGCTGTYSNASLGKLFTNCQCVPSGIARQGSCAASCNTLVPYAVLMFVTNLAGSMAIIPMITTLIRAVDEKDKALSLAGATFVMNVGAFPAPILTGLVIDSTCLVSQTSCSRQGACLLYNQDSFRFRLHGYAIGVKCCALIMYIIGLFMSKNYTMLEHSDAKYSEELQQLNKPFDKEKVQQEP